MGASKVLGILLMIAGLGMVGLQMSGKVQGTAPLYGAAGSMFLAIILLLISAAGSSDDDDEDEYKDDTLYTDETVAPVEKVKAAVFVLENGQRVKNIDSDEACKDECDGHAACRRHTYAKNKAGSMACKLYTEEEVADDEYPDEGADYPDEGTDYTDEEEEEDTYMKKSGHILAGTSRSYMGEGNLQIEGIDAINVKECKTACKSLDEDGDGCHGFEYESGKGGKDITCQPFHLKGKKDLIEDRGMHTYILRSKVKDSDLE